MATHDNFDLFQLSIQQNVQKRIEQKVRYFWQWDKVVFNSCVDFLKQAKIHATDYESAAISLWNCHVQQSIPTL